MYLESTELDMQAERISCIILGILLFDATGKGEVLETKKEDILRARISSKEVKDLRDRFPFKGSEKYTGLVLRN